jgi:hypothetical protein
MMVTADGAVMPCCFTSGQMGNLYEASADEIWNGDVAMELRRFIRAGEIHPICADAPCKFVQNMRQDEGVTPVLRGNFDEQQEVTEKIKIREEFDENFYAQNYPDVTAAIGRGEFVDGWRHYELHGRDEGRRGKP